MGLAWETLALGWDMALPSEALGASDGLPGPWEPHSLVAGLEYPFIVGGGGVNLYKVFWQSPAYSKCTINWRGQ